VLWRRNGSGRVEVGLVHRPRYDDWSFPKGKLAPDEHPTVAAIREIAEETGQRAALGRPLPTAYYQVNGAGKIVHYWAAMALGGEFAPGAEVDALAWLEPEGARARLSHETDAALLGHFLAEPPDTLALIVLRHARALARRDWAGEDIDRPLHPDGLLQPARLAGIIDAFGVHRVFSSPARRCLMTISEFTEMSGAAIEALPGLMEDASAAEFEAAHREVAAAAREASVVVVTHRPVFPVLFDALSGAGWPGAPAAGLHPGELVVGHRHERRIVAWERHQG